MNCRTCIYRRDIPGDCHSSCVHPLIQASSHSEFAIDRWDLDEDD